MHLLKLEETILPDTSGPIPESGPSCAMFSRGASRGRRVLPLTCWSTWRRGHMSAPTADSASAERLTWRVTAEWSTLSTIRLCC
ncbi:hypothetical protein V5799_033017 [Amblyomma americanum]|uniref:Uncharacterized protein n=1 Tax=Amblyomma americanum TaxID=6943 RepID=A0AAQ4DPI5_AMBAM